MLQTQTVTDSTLAIIKRLMADSQLQEFLLVGGTALALTIGHRHSVDIDLFTQNSFDSKALGQQLSTRYNATRMKTIKNGIFCSIGGIKVDLISHSYPEIEPHQVTEGIRMASLTDIAAMKLHAIIRSGERLKDFVDIYFLLERMSLSAMYTAYEQKYFPDANAGIARMALTDTSLVNLKDRIRLFDREFDWDTTKLRLQQAIEFTQKIFPSIKQNRFRNDPPEQKRGFRM